MPDEPGPSAEEQQLMRFRRWIAMTPDSKWREFRGTAEMVDVGKDEDLVELVDGMMEARISHFEEMLDGWKIMRSGLTPNNAAHIYSEMMQNLASLMNFETQNFSKSNYWTEPKPRDNFPRYLSDCPVRDGDTTSASKSGESQLMVRFVASDSIAKQEEYLRSVFGDFVPQQLIEMLRKCEEQRNSAAAVSSQPTSSQSTVSANTSRQCSGIGFTFDPKNRMTIMTRLSSDVTQPLEVQVPTIPVPVTASTHPRPPALMDLPTQQSQLVSPVAPVLPAPVISAPLPQPTPNSQILALLVVEKPAGEMVTMGYVPVSYTTLVSPFTTSYHPNPPPSQQIQEEPMPQSIPQPVRPAGNSRNSNRNRRNAARRQQQEAERNQQNQQQDSGFCSPGEEPVPPTRESTPQIAPVNVTDREDEHLNQDSSTPTSVSVEPEKEAETATETHVETETPTVPTEDTASKRNEAPTTPKLVPTYASIVTMNEVNKTDRTTTTTSNVVMGSSLLGREETESTEIAVSGREPTSSSSGLELESEETGWQVVKNKHPVVVVVVTELEESRAKSAREPRTSEAAEESSESTAEEGEVDPNEERRRENLRLRRQRRRAAKIQKKNEARLEKRRREEQVAQEVLARICAEAAVRNRTRGAGTSGPVRPFQGTQPVQLPVIELVPAHASDNGEVVGSSSAIHPEPEVLTVQEVPVQEPEQVTQQEVVETPILDAQVNSSGQRKFSDDDIIKETEEEEDEDDNREPKEQLFLDCQQHAKIMFRLLWFDNKKKLEKLYIDDAERQRLQSLLDMVRAMKDRVDMAGRMIVYRVGRPQIPDHIEENIVKVARNLIDVTRHTLDNDMGMAKTICELVGKMAKNFTYLNYVFSILTLPGDFFPKLATDDPRLNGYKEIITLTHLHMRRVQRIYENLGDLYEFKIVKVPKNRSRRD